MNSKKNEHYFLSFCCLIALVAISQATVRTFMLWNAPQIEIFYEVKNEVWGGGSLWATSLRILEGNGTYVWSNRLLAPYVILAISKLGVSYKVAAIIFYWAGIFVINFTIYFLLLRSKASHHVALAWVTFFNFMFLIFQDRSGWGWFYSFDILSILFFTIFAYLAVNKKIGLLIITFAFAITNREDAIFIALYIALSGVSFKAGFPLVKIEQARRLATGAALGVFAVGYTKYIRDHVSLLKPSDDQRAIGNSITSIGDALYNLIIRNFSTSGDPYLFNAPDGLWLIGSTAVMCSVFGRVTQERKNLILTYVAMVLAIIVFGNAGANEVRLYMPLFPVFIFTLFGVNLSSTRRY
jgi:hypothetical protein